MLDAGEFLPVVSRWRRIRACRHSREIELRLLPLLVRDRTFVDVGANRGTYSYAALGSGAVFVVALEPHDHLAAVLRRSLGRRGTVHAAAASSTAGTAILSVPTVDGVQRDTRSSIAELPDDQLSRSFQVPTITLDDLGIPKDAIIKIDVEGHEEAVLEGAKQLLSERRATAFLIESEERQAPGTPIRLINLMISADYQGWAIQGALLIDVHKFEVESHQSRVDVAVVSRGESRPDSYANNFIFIRTDESPNFKTAASEAGFSFENDA